MAIRIYDPSILNAQGALLDFTALIRQRGGQIPGVAVSDKGRSLFLRWQTSPGAGLPSEPFKVWRRPALPLGQHKAVGFELIQLPPILEVLQFDEPLASVAIAVRSSAGGAVVVAVLSGPPVAESIVTLQTRTLPAGGVAAMEFQAPLITGLALFNVSSFDGVTGLTTSELDKVEAWQLVETVGLPVDEGDWAPQGQRHGVKQGMVGAEAPARDAAVDRFKRGINPLGWWPAFPGGAPAPVWEMPDPARLVEEATLELLPMLRQAAESAPDQQAARLFQFAIDPPQNPAGDVMPASNPGKADLSPIGLLAMSVASDPMLSVTLGYGTGYPDEDIPQINLGDRSLFGDRSRSDWDWLITGLWEKGLDGASDPVEFAALVPRPALALPAPTPADLAVDFQAHLRPTHADQPWIASVRTSWERFPLNQLSNVASFAAARHRSGGGAAEALLERRALTTGHRPIGNARNERDPEPTRQSATDGALQVPPSPGSVALTYAAATQTLFGVWSRWTEGPITVGQPEPALVQILSADLRAADPGAGALCPASLVMEISVDWRVRSVDRVELRGRLFAAATRSTPPPAPPPAGLQKSLGGAAAATHITFAGDTPSLAGATVVALDPNGSQVVAPGPATQSASRRYRITIPGFSLDYAATPHVGLALEARLRERLAPNRVGAWSPTRKLAYASDPRARPTTVVDLVRLASLPDAAGECHAHINWAAIPGAIGYAVYESTETRLHTSHPGLPQPTPDRSLSQRLTTLKTAFAAAPVRRDFVRRNAELITTTDVDVTLPRGTRDIHLYTVLPVMAGGQEAPWPSGPDADKVLIPYAAPKIAVPAPPTLEVQLVSDKAPAPPNYRARLRIGTRGDAGARPKRIDIYRVRVDDAARRLDSMGPPIATLTSTGGGWTVSPPEGGGDWIDTVTGFDQPGGSWRRVWYRAVAWSEDDPLRAVLKGRSEASPAVSVVVPPAGPPDLSPLTVSWPGGDLGAVLISFTSTAPVQPTPLGPHKLSIDAAVAGGAPLISAVVVLDQLALAPPATGSGAWRLDGPPTAFRLLLRRASVNDAVSVIVRLADPLGRVREQAVTIAPGSVAPLPSLSPIDAFTIAGRGRVFTFSTDAPNNDGAGGAHRIRVELTPAAVGPAPFPPRPPLGPRGPLGPRPPIGRSQFRLIDGVYVYDAPLSSVPTAAAGSAPAGVTLALGRQAPPLDDNFSILATLDLQAVLVRLTLADGRTVERRRRG